MIISISTQIALITFSFLSGLLTGLVYDIYRLAGGFRTANKFISFITDLLFWIFTAVFVFIFLLYTNSGHVGFYVYIYIFSGIFVYHKFISKAYMNIQKSVIIFIGKIFRIIKNLIFYPFALIFYKIKGKTKK
jgi:spore cortex biosynthesis protein YabQ